MIFREVGHPLLWIGKGCEGQPEVHIRLRLLPHASEEDPSLGAPVFAIFAQGRLSTRSRRRPRSR